VQQRKMGRETIAKAFLENEAFSLSPRRASISIRNQTLLSAYKN